MYGYLRVEYLRFDFQDCELDVQDKLSCCFDLGIVY